MIKFGRYSCWARLHKKCRSSWNYLGHIFLIEQDIFSHLSTYVCCPLDMNITISNSICLLCCYCCWVTVTSHSLKPHVLKHTRLPYPSAPPRVWSISHPLSQGCHATISSSLDPSSPAYSLSEHQGLFQWITSSHQVAKVLEFQLQPQSFQWIFRVDFL